jgi:predicted RNA-binding Zn ribbon-like protein
MSPVAEKPAEWVDGFLFVGNQLALDFLNTKPVIGETPTELLVDVAALERWLIAAGVLERARAPAWRKSTNAEAFLKKLLAFREKLRAEVVRLERGSSISDAFLAELNRLLRDHPCRMAIRGHARKLTLGIAFEPRDPEDAWAPIVASAADLLSGVTADRVRKCESEDCVLHFYDTSKKGSRRWCSMNICGNKVKVAAYRKRNRAV